MDGVSTVDTGKVEIETISNSGNTVSIPAEFDVECRYCGASDINVVVSSISGDVGCSRW